MKVWLSLRYRVQEFIFAMMILINNTEENSELNVSVVIGCRYLDMASNFAQLRAQTLFRFYSHNISQVVDKQT